MSLFFNLRTMKKIFSLLLVLSVSFSVIAQPEDPKALHETAKTFMRSGDFDNAIIVLTRALQQDKNNLEMQKDLVMSYYLKRDYQKALEGVKVLVDRDDADAVLGGTLPALALAATVGRGQAVRQRVLVP